MLFARFMFLVSLAPILILIILELDDEHVRLEELANLTLLSGLALEGLRNR